MDLKQSISKIKTTFLLVLLVPFITSGVYSISNKQDFFLPDEPLLYTATFTNSQTELKTQKAGFVNLSPNLNYLLIYSVTITGNSIYGSIESFYTNGSADTEFNTNITGSFLWLLQNSNQWKDRTLSLNGTKNQKAEIVTKYQSQCYVEYQLYTNQTEILIIDTQKSMLTNLIVIDGLDIPNVNCHGDTSEIPLMRLELTPEGAFNSGSNDDDDLILFKIVLILLILPQIIFVLSKLRTLFNNFKRKYIDATF